MNLDELKVKPIWQMTGEELLFLMNNGLTQFPLEKEDNLAVKVNDYTKRKHVYGINGIAKLFNCSLSTASRIKQSGKIDQAIKQFGRKIIVDAELALELFGKKGGRNK